MVFIKLGFGYETVRYGIGEVQSDLSTTTKRVTLPHARRLWLVRFVQFAEYRTVKDKKNHDNIMCYDINLFLHYDYYYFGMRPVQ